MEKNEITVIGGGLAGCEAALWLAKKGVKVKLVEQKPLHFSPAHTKETLAELVCSNSFKAEREDSAGGLLKAEMKLLGSSLLPLANNCRVPAGGALAVDRDLFSEAVTKLVYENQNISFEKNVQQQLNPENGILIVATGPLTENPLAQSIAGLTQSNSLSFYDAAAPIVTANSIDETKVFAAARYERGEADYLNCPFNKAEYELFHKALLSAQVAQKNEFDGPVTVYEGCMPVEIMASRGVDTLRYGPLRPVGLINPATGHRPWANVQLRKENANASLYNLVGFQTSLKFGEQEKVFRMIPGLENAEFVRFGVMHRNTFLNSPKVLNNDLSLKNHENLFFAGQITGFEGYMESAACGLLAAHAVYAKLIGETFKPPSAQTMCGALMNYIGAANKNFQPMGANMGLLPPLEKHVRDKRERYAAVAQRALDKMQLYVLADG